MIKGKDKLDNNLDERVTLKGIDLTKGTSGQIW